PLNRVTVDRVDVDRRRPGGDSNREITGAYWLIRLDAPPRDDTSPGGAHQRIVVTAFGRTNCDGGYPYGRRADRAHEQLDTLSRDENLPRLPAEDAVAKREAGRSSGDALDGLSTGDAAH